MNGVLKAVATSVPIMTLRRLAAGLAVGSVAVAVGVAAFVGPPWGWWWAFALPVLVAWSVCVVAAVVRVRLVGFVPAAARDDDFIPAALQPWIRFWLVFRLGLLWAMLLLIVAFVAAAISRRGATVIAEALIYVVVVRMFVDGAFGVALNLGIITRRRLVR